MSISPHLGHPTLGRSEPSIQKAGQTGSLPFPLDNLIRASTRPYSRLPATGSIWVVMRADLNRGLPCLSSPTLLIVKASAFPSSAPESATTWRVSLVLVYVTLLLLGSF